VATAEAAERIADVAKSIGIGELLDRPAATYSGGQRRRLEIARALVSRPQVLFLDEPTVGLDPRIRHELLDVIAGLRDHSEMTILLTTHYLDEAQRLCDRVAIMHDGRIVALDRPAALLAGLGRELLELRLEGDVVAALDTLRSNGLAGDEAFAVGSTVTLPLNGHSAADAIASARDIGLQLASISTREPTLDDVYLRLTGDRLDDAA
jgi:ABC-2 type transport system ATP-binding protein